MSWRRLICGLSLLSGWLCSAGVAFAAKREAEAASANDSTVGAYAIVGLSILLGLFAVCHPSRRSDRSGPVRYGE